MESITYQKEVLPSKLKPQQPNKVPLSQLSKTSTFCCLFFLLVAQYLSAQEAVSDSLSGWKHQREIGLLVNQSSFNNWLAGGTTNFSGTLNFDYNITFQDEVWLWTATADVALGFAKIDSEEFVKKTEDRLAIDAVLERKSNKRWKWSSSINLKTQNTPSYTFVDGQNNQIERIKSTAFFSPAYLRLGVGTSYRKSESFSLQFQPLTARVILVDKVFTHSIDPDDSYFGVKQGESARWEAGASLSMQAKHELVKNVFFSNTLSLFSNYLTETKNIDLDYTGTLDMKVNKYLSAMLELQLVYDDNALNDLQLRQVFGLALSLPF